jgi:multidrug efflux pump subunit AcrB
MANLKLFLLGPGEGGKIQIRITGSNGTKLREISDKVVNIMEEDGNARGIRYDWREMVKTIRPTFSETQARRSGITRPDLTDMMTLAYDGKQVSVYRERDLLLPIKVRAPENERIDVVNLRDTQIWSPIIQKYIPVRQIAPNFGMVYDDSRIWRRNRKKTITVHCDQRKGVASVLLNRIWPKINEIDLPSGYFFERGGEYQDSVEAQQALAASIPMFVVIMILIVICLFNALRQPLIIWLTVPLAIIGVTLGLLVTRQPFGFMALLGFLSLTGMLIKNSIVLIDQIDLEIREGKEPFRAIMDSSVSRMRPVMMAAATTVLGMTPLLFDAFFIAMAVTIMFGLTFASVLTLIVVPVFYAIFFRIKYNKEAV